MLPSPVRCFRLLTALLLAHEAHRKNQSLTRRLRKVEAKLLGARHLADAKAILMKAHDVSEVHAYDLIRDQAMSKRATVEEIAALIVQASEVLSLGARRPG